jgi:hypothetical protein
MLYKTQFNLYITLLIICIIFGILISLIFYDKNNFYSNALFGFYMMKSGCAPFILGNICKNLKMGLMKSIMMYVLYGLFIIAPLSFLCKWYIGLVLPGGYDFWVGTSVYVAVSVTMFIFWKKVGFGSSDGNAADDRL